MSHVATTKGVLIFTAFGILAMIARDVQPSGQTALPPSRNQEPVGASKTNPGSITRFASDDFFAGAYLDLDGVVTSDGYATFPVDRILSTEILLDRYQPSPIKEIAIFVASSAPSQSSTGALFEVAATIRLKKPTEPKQFLSKIAKVISPSLSETGVPIETMTVANRDCYRVPSGTFLNPRNKGGRLQFIAKDGSIKPRGANIGDVAPYDYFPGTKEGAFFTFNGLSDSDLITGTLQLKLRMSVFRIRFLEEEFGKAQIFLQQPGGHLASDPITFEAKSLVSQTFEFPRVLTGTDADGSPRKLDLCDDLIVDGRLGVVVKSLNQSVYLGFVQDSVQVNTVAAEFIAFNGSDVLVAQSKQRLEEMLTHAEESRLSKRLNPMGRQIALFAEIENRTERKSLEAFFELISLKDVASYLPETGSISGSAEIAESVSGQMKLVYQGSRSASGLRRKLRYELATARETVKQTTLDAIRRVDVTDRLRTLVLPDVPERPPGLNISRPDFDEHLAECLDSFFDGVKIASDNESLSVEFDLAKPLSRDARLDQLVLAALDLKRVFELHNYKKSYLSDRIHSHVTDRLPNEFSAWSRRAHQLTFNTSIAFDGFETRYDWVRRGIDVLLDGAEQNPDSSDLIWMAAKFIAMKIGHRTDDRFQYQELFSTDKELQIRLESYVDFSDARSADGQIDPWLMARLLFQYCIQEHISSGKKSSVVPFLLFSAPARTQVECAASLDEQGQFDLAVKQWAEAERLFEELMGQPEILVGSIKISPLLSNDRQSLEQGIQHKALLQTWIRRTQFEQTPSARTLRKRAFDAKALSKQNRVEESYQLYFATMKSISELVLAEPDNANYIFESLADVIEGYQTVAKKLKIRVDDSLAPMMESFRQHRTKYFILQWL